MRARYPIFCLCLALSWLLLGCVELELESRAPASPWRGREAADVLGPAVAEDSPRFATAEYATSPRVARPRSVSLGFIGDDSIGRYPSVPHRAPSWTRPFPGAWGAAYQTSIARPYRRR
jgi:hypothetical protein